MEADEYKRLINLGQKSLNIDLFKEASDFFVSARTLVTTIDEYLYCSYWLGVSYRKNGKFVLAENCLKNAMLLAKKNGNQYYAAKLMKELGVVFFREISMSNNLKNALETIENAKNIFEKIAEEIEAANCSSILIEIKLHENTIDKQEAVKKLLTLEKILHNQNADYELNNLLRLCKLSVKYQAKYIARITWLLIERYAPQKNSKN